MDALFDVLRSNRYMIGGARPAAWAISILAHGVFLAGLQWVINFFHSA